MLLDNSLLFLFKKWYNRPGAKKLLSVILRMNAKTVFTNNSENENPKSLLTAVLYQNNLRPIAKLSEPKSSLVIFVRLKILM